MRWVRSVGCVGRGAPVAGPGSCVPVGCGSGWPGPVGSVLVPGLPRAHRFRPVGQVRAAREVALHVQELKVSFVQVEDIVNELLNRVPVDVIPQRTCVIEYLNAVIYLVILAGVSGELGDSVLQWV